MKSQHWVIIDTETDGLWSPIHVVEIAAQVMEGWDPVGEPFRVFLNHDVPISDGAFALHGYTQEFLREHGLPARDAYDCFRAYVKTCPVTSHNLKFDWDTVLEPEWASLGIPAVGIRGFCLLTLD